MLDTVKTNSSVAINTDKGKKRKRQKSDKVRQKKKKTEPDYDSDTPIASMIYKNEPSSKTNKVDIEGIGHLKDETAIVKGMFTLFFTFFNFFVTVTSFCFICQEV